jgi:Protein of unknown function (DUF4242)
MRRNNMPLYMDHHHKVDGLTADAVAGAHQRDLEVQAKYGVEYLKYWFDEGSGAVFCLVHAPSKEAAAAVHQEAHGLGADEITEVQEGA